MLKLILKLLKTYIYVDNIYRIQLKAALYSLRGESLKRTVVRRGEGSRG